MAFYIGDVPSVSFGIEPARDLTPFNSVTVQLLDPEGAVVPLIFTGSIVDDEVVIVWPATTPFAVAGVYSLRVTLTNTVTSVRERLAPIRIIVQAEDGWHTVDSAREDWEDAPDSDAAVYDLLELAKDAVLEYAPALAVDAPIPVNYRAGQRGHAENIWNSTRVNPTTGGDGDGSFVMRPFPLDWQIKQILRPKSGTGFVG